MESDREPSVLLLLWIGVTTGALMLTCTSIVKDHWITAGLGFGGVVLCGLFLTVVIAKGRLK